ncbi:MULTISPECIES: LacI family DNA-binding transcriptional regulator [Anaerotruncus]|jgi:LacI family transcriptional regulator|uniref:LacI family DNA-binding transcriptional regulator n=1 Tax=Anaerotruncus TaxID=244127 RepID=UPI000836B27A|nr:MULTISPECIES: LacI family DNA-binding transcriptional regulator [Anaerotruncus]RGX56155.1 LacI family transcriptional regulator [Anaerotruncus sp. AF02-27]
MTQKATIAQVAQRAGCSLATVSRVLSGSNYPVKADVRERILLCARELGYVSPSVRKPAKSRVGKDIGVLIPTLTNPFYSQLLVGVENVCEEHGYTPFFCSSHRDPEKEIENLKFFLSKSVSGIILSSINENHVFLSSLLQQDIPLVVFDQSLRELDVSYVKFDYFEAAKLAVEHLYLKGHRRIAFASPPINRSVRQEALNGYLFGLEEFSVPQRQEYIILSEAEKERDDGMYDFENGKYFAGRILQLEKRPTAVFTLNDMTAFGLIDEFRRQDLQVPEDISVVGFDNLEQSSFFYPPLTTINQPAYEIGRLTAKILMDKISGKRVENAAINLRPSIVERASVRALY